MGSQKEKQKKIAEFERNQALKAVQTGEAEHYAFIIDRSDAGLLLEFHILNNGPAELNEEFFQDAFKQWRASSMPFLVIWGSFDAEHNLAMGAQDEEELLNTALLEIQTRTQEHGNCGCAFFLGLTPSVSNKLRERLASSPQPLGAILH